MTSGTTAVRNLYNTYPFPPDPIVDAPPPGYNWRWNWVSAHSFCTGYKPKRQDIRILDAGCGTGSGTDYLIHLNPFADVTAIDLSEKALELAQQRCIRSKAIEKSQGKIEFHHLQIENCHQLEGQFDFINCVGVLHHLPDPIAGIQALASKLKEGGLFHIFVYAELGRWEIQLMQEAIRLLQGEKIGDYTDGVKIGREIFKQLPEDNRLVKREKERWAMENHRDESFADMYVHPQETDYNINTLFQFIEASGLEFLGFSNPSVWDINRLVGRSNLLLERFQQLSPKEQYRLIELLDPQITHYEFFLTKPPLQKTTWENDQELLLAIPERNPSMDGFPSPVLFNYDYQIINLSDSELLFLKACDGNTQKSVKTIIEETKVSLEEVRLMQQKQLIILDQNSSH